MIDEKPSNVPKITRFVREVLGCNCSDEVFQRVELKRGSTAIKSCSADYELQIGGRLLIVFTSEPVDRLNPVRLGEVIAEGKRARDAAHFNRFRLVVQAENAAQAKEGLLRTFEAIPTKDEKTHLHVVEKREMPDFYS